MRQKQKYKTAKKKVSFKRCILVVMEKANFNSMLLSYKIMFYFFYHCRISATVFDKLLKLAAQ